MIERKFEVEVTFEMKRSVVIAAEEEDAKAAAVQWFRAIYADTYLDARPGERTRCLRTGDIAVYAGNQLIILPNWG